MCDVKKYEQLYQEIKPEDTLQLVSEAEPEEQFVMFGMVLKIASTKITYQRKTFKHSHSAIRHYISIIDIFIIFL